VNLFFQLIASRYEQGSVMVTSNLPFGRWGEVFGDEIDEHIRSSAARRH